MRVCAACSAPIKERNKTGYCGKHAKQSPAYRAKLGEAVRRANQRDPSIRERKSAAMREIAATPEWTERNRRLATERRLWEHGVPARTPESNAAAGRTFSRRHGYASWCPEDYVPLARDLRKTGLPLDEVKRMVADQIEADLAGLRKRMGAR